MHSSHRKQVYAIAEAARLPGKPYFKDDQMKVGAAILAADQSDIQLRNQRASGSDGIPEIRTERGMGTCPGYFGTRVPKKGNRNKTRP